jgi:16S rRNA (cytosine967-C5)-methyltransferase
MNPASFNAVSREKPREIAARVLQRRQTGKFVEDLLEQAFAGDASRLSPADRGLCQELTYGVVRWEATLDYLIARKTQGRTQKAALQNLLRLGLYQIFWLDRIPNHAAVNETVEMAKHGGFGPQSGFVNAVLRGYLREFDATKSLLADLKKAQPHIGYSHPQWLVERWQKRWGTEKTAQLLEWNNTPPKTFARVNELAFHKSSRQFDERKIQNVGELLTLWRDENVEYDFVRRDWLKENVVFELKSHPPLMKLGSFQRGFFYVQDPSTLLAVRELNPQPGETILDLCAAPGGKASYIAQLMRNEGKLIAHDPVPDRLKLIEENCARLGVTCAQTVSSLDLQPSTFDRILIDAPCSNTGVMRRRVDLRWRIQLGEIQRLREMQLDLLRRAAPLLKPGGTLVYSTCSLEPEENVDVAEQFLREQPDFKKERQRELLPFVDRVDGAFVARLIRER